MRTFGFTIRARRPFGRLALFLFSGFLCASPVASDAIPVAVEKTEQGWQLTRGGEPYFIKGAGGTHSMERLAAAGANSIRTWGTDKAGDILDQAHELGLTVALGVWLGHERHGFDYDDEEQVRQQFEKVRQDVLKYKDHPALLLWGVGNEMEGFEAGDNPAIWKAVNDIAAMIKRLDPNHPTMTVTAEIGGERIKYVHALSPAIDIHGINSYGGAPSLPKRLNEKGATKPYVITEFGPRGAWEVATTDWDAPFEQTSTEKADFTRRSYEKGVLEAKGMALGSYVFGWGYKMEATATWMGMFLPDGSKLGAIDVMTELWSGSKPANLAPEISALSLVSSSSVKPNALVKFTSTVTDPENDELTAFWALRSESGEYLTGGDFRPFIPDIEDAVLEGDVNGARLRMPDYPGAYRVFLYVRDKQGSAATANVPIKVLGKVRPRMPMSVYSEGLEGMRWVPSGWMGGVDFLTLDGESTEHVRSGKTSIKLRFAAKSGWAGVVWQHPADNWGEKEGGFDVTGAKALEVWARGEYGGEKVSFGVGIIGEDKPFPDSGKTKVDGVVLTDEWKLYRVPLRRMDLSSIKSGFVITMSSRRTPVTVYLDDIRFVR